MKSCNHDKGSIEHDLKQIFACTKGLWEEIRGQRIFMTGGTGFFGTWLLESLLWADNELDLGVEILVLSRSPEKFKSRLPHLASHKAIKLHEGDIRDFEFPAGEFSYIIHGASTSSVEKHLGVDDATRYQITTDGTTRVLEFAVQCSVRKMLLVSSGAVYGKQSEDIEGISETTPFGLAVGDDACYCEAKRAAEMMSIKCAEKYEFEVKIARCFSFIGPHFPLDIHFAIGNFIKAGINGGPIFIHGDGTPVRSYMYASDLVIWLWTILFRGKCCRPYNVGSDEAVSISDLAIIISQCFEGNVKVEIARDIDKGKEPEWYVPSINRARNELNLRLTVMLKSAIESTGFYLEME